MKKIIFNIILGLLLFPFLVIAQEEFSISPEAEALFNRAMSQINQRHVNWVKSIAIESNEKKLTPDDMMIRARTYAGTMNLKEEDIEFLCGLSLMLASKDAQEDLKALMAQLKALNDQKEKLKSAINMMNDRRQSFTRFRLDSIKSISAQTQVIQKQNTLWNTQPVRTVTLDSTKPVRANTPVTRAEINATADKLKNDLDSMSEMGEMESLRLQMAMDRMSKMMSTLSNILKKISDTANSIIQNLK